MSKKLFIATSFSSKVDDSGNVLSEFRAEIEAILKELRKSKNAEVFCAIEAEGWKISDMLAEVGVHKDLQEINLSDVVLIILSDKPSWGVQFEMGYAVAKGKAVFIAAPPTIKLSYFNQGLVDLNQITYITYENPQSLIARLNLQ